MSDESEHSESEFYYPEELTDMELLQLPTDVQRKEFFNRRLQEAKTPKYSFFLTI